MQTGKRKSWQVHLVRISPFLVPGEGVRWEEDEDGYTFRDGHCDCEKHHGGSDLLHLRSSSLKDVPSRQKAQWKVIYS